MTITLENGYSSESTQRELFNENQHDRVQMIFKNFLCTLDENSLSIGRVNDIVDLRTGSNERHLYPPRRGMKMDARVDVRRCGWNAVKQFPFCDIF